MARRFSEPVPSVRRVRPAVPDHVDRALQRALSPVPADRFQTAAEFRQVLEGAASSTTLGAVHEDSEPSGHVRHRHSRSGITLGLGFLIGIGMLFGWLQSQKGDRREGLKRLAVLPFAAVGDTNDRAFAVGMSEEITTRLARVPGLQLIARSSALQYPQSGKTAPQFGRELGVDYVLDGTVRSAAGQTGPRQLRITPELIKVADGTRLWGEPYSGVMADVFQLQSQIAERVAQSLQGTLEGQARRAVRVVPTDDPEAFRLYTLGRAEWNLRNPENLLQAANYFRLAIARDSGFARAWAGLADAYALYPYYRVLSVPRDTAYARARAAALRAIELDSTLAEPHASLNQIMRYGYWDWEASEREIRKALVLDPGYATAHQWYGEHLMDLGHLPEAIAEARTAVRLDPLARPTQNFLGLVLYYAGETDEAIEVLLGAVRRDPKFGQHRANLISLYVRTGRVQEALALAPAEDTFYLRTVMRAQKDRFARDVALDMVRALGKEGAWGPARMSREYAFLGEREMAFVQLRRAVAERDPGLEMIKVEPDWAPLRGDPRFRAIVTAIGLPP